MRLLLSCAASGGRMRSLFTLVVIVALSGCSCGDVTLFDPFAPVGDDPGADSLHAYASHARVPFRLRAAGLLDVHDLVVPVATGAVSVATDVNLVVDPTGMMSFTIVTADAGDGQVSFVDKHGNTITSRGLSVLDADELSLAVTAPATPGVVLPGVSLAGTRIFAGGHAAFRTTLQSNDNEVFGVSAVAARPADATFTTRSGTGCAPDTCDAVRNALEISVPDTAAAPVDVVLTAGSAEVTLTVVPTVDADITDVALVQADAVNKRGDAVLQVLAGTEPVLGAPVVWSVDGTELDDDQGKAFTGDALQFDVANQAHAIVAALGAHNANASVKGTKFAVTSITAACGAAPASTTPAAVLLVALAGVRGQRRRRR